MRPSVHIEEVTQFWDRQPCNVKHGTAPVGTPEWSEQVTQRRYFVEPHIKTFANFSWWSRKQVLEVGCGIGTDTLEFAKVGAYIDAVDISQKSVDIARARMPLPEFINVGLYVMDGEKRLPFAGFMLEEGYDLAYSFGVIHHTPHPERVVANIFRRLKPGGEFRLMLYARHSIKNFFQQQPEAQAGCPLAQTYTKSMVRKLLKDFQIVSITQAHIFPWRVKDYVEHRYVKEWYYRLMPKSFFNFLQRHFGWHLLIVARKPA